MDICSSPRLFAACHVLRRLLMPRHSPCALSSLTCSSQSPLRSVSAGCLSASVENSARSLAPRFSPKTGFRRVRTGVTELFRTRSEVSENSWFSLRIMQALQRFEIVCHPASFRMLFHNQFSLPCISYRTPLCCLTLLCHIVQFSRCRVPTAFAVRFEDPILADQVFKSKGKSPGGPEWARTTDLTIISRTL